jgi:hypothetical protein
MSDDIRSILEKLTTIESKLTPTSVKHGLNKQQDSVPQLPALFKPKHISVLGAKKDPKHPMSGYAVGADESAQPKGNALAEAMAEIEEDMLSKVKRDLTTYLDKLEKKVKADPELLAKAVDDVEDANPAKAGKQTSSDASDDEDLEEDDYELTDPSTVHDVEDKINTTLAQPQAPVQTETLDDGAVFEIHGDEHNGFEIRHKGRSLPSRFKNINDADTAIKLFKAHRARNNTSADYVEER